MGLYTTHVFVPPTPGPIAAAGALHASIGSVIFLGLIVTVPVIIVTYLFALFMGNRIFISPAMDDSNPDQSDFKSYPTEKTQKPGFLASLTPILAPMILIALGSVAALPSHPFGQATVTEVIGFLGNPTTALVIGVLLAFVTIPQKGSEVYSKWVTQGLKEAGTIILITGAGGAFGAILRATHIGSFLGKSLSAFHLGIFLPFLIAAALKTAQGSSTVAIITTASITVPLLSDMGLSHGWGPVLVTLAIGAGAMTVSHANDSYFWVVSQFSDMDVSQAYRLQTVGSAVAGCTGIITIFLLSLILA